MTFSLFGLEGYYNTNTNWYVSSQDAKLLSLAVDATGRLVNLLSRFDDGCDG